MAVTLNALSANWRIALAAAHDALTAGTDTLPAAELHLRNVRLSQERDQVQRLLEADALVEHTRLVRHLTLPTTGRAQLGLPAGIDACIFDLDGVLAPSADVHFAAWAEVIDRFLGARFPTYPTLSRIDYADHMHGRPRLDGLRSFFASRGITVSSATLYVLADAKSAALNARLARPGFAAFAGAIRYLEALSAAGLACIVVSPSANTATFLERASISDLVDVVVDGKTMQTEGLEPKPAPDMLLAACAALNIEPRVAASFETTAAGVAASRTAGIGLVVAVARAERDESLTGDRIIGDLGELL